MGHVFISYSRKDQSTARSLANDLRRHGFDVWMDDRIDYGEQWLNVIFEAIRQSSALVVIMSPDAEASKWVQKEHLYAEKVGKLVLPLMLNGHIFPYFVNVQVGAVTESGGLPADFYGRLQAVIPPKPITGTVFVATPRKVSKPPTPPPPKATPPTRKPVTPKPVAANSWHSQIGTAITLFLVAAMIVALMIAATQGNRDNNGSDRISDDPSATIDTASHTVTLPPTLTSVPSAFPSPTPFPTIGSNGKPRIAPITQINCTEFEVVQMLIEVTDPDGDPLQLSIESSNAALVAASLLGNYGIEVNCLADGNANVTLVADDGRGGRAVTFFPVHVLDSDFWTPSGNCPAINAGTATACAIIGGTQTVQ